MVTIGSCELDSTIMVIKLSGKIDTMTVNGITTRVMAAMEESPAGVMFNLGGVTFVSSAGLRMFVSAYKKGLSANMKMAMIHVHPSVYKIFKMVGCEGMFNIFDDEPQALKKIWGI